MTWEIQITYENHGARSANANGLKDVMQASLLWRDVIRGFKRFRISLALRSARRVPYIPLDPVNDDEG